MNTTRLCCLVTLLVAAHPARADPDPVAGTTEEIPAPGTDEARKAFLDGTRLAKAERWHEALDSFERSARLREHPVTTYNIAYCARALGQHTRSWLMFSRALQPSGAGELPPELLRSANVYRPEVEQKLAHVRVDLPRALSLVVDDRPIESIAAGRFVAGTRPISPPERHPSGTFELLADPGPHTFVLTLSDGSRRLVRRVLHSGDNGTLTLVIEVRREPARALAAPRDLRPTSSTGPSYAWPIVAFGVGTVGLTVGTVFGLRALSEERELDKACPSGACPPDHGARLDEARRDAMVSNVGFGIGIAGVAVGTYLLLTGSTRRNDMGFAPWFGPSAAGATGKF